MVTTGTALAFAGLSAVGFALSTSLQHRAAGLAPSTTQGTRQLLAHLAHRPWWVVGQVIALAAFALHASALHLGTLVVVQPVVVSGLVLAVPIRAGLARRHPSRGELATVAVTAAGLALFLVAARPAAGQPPRSPWAAVLLTAAGTIMAVGAVWRAGRSKHGERAALWFGVAAGVLFGLVAGLVKLTTTTATLSSHGGFSILSTWSTWAVLVAGLCGVACNQRAYRAARLSASMPILNIVDVGVALVFGIVVFGESPAHGPVAVAAELIAMGCIAFGLRRLSRSEFAVDGASEQPITTISGLRSSTSFGPGRPRRPDSSTAEVKPDTALHHPRSRSTS